MSVRATEISDIIKSQIAGFQDSATVTNVGRVVSIGDGLAAVYGLSNVMASELVRFPRTDTIGLAFNLGEDSVGVIVLGEYDMAPHMQRLLREAGHDVPASKPILEINPQHALVQRFAAETDAARSADLAQLLLEEAQLTAGDQLPDPSAFIARVNRIVLGA